ncbi:acyl-CoA dehydrogenase family protein [Iamia majanohamensis]|uniref:Acyl-CoA dehydrogenase family protein n=1 Tax=Iamia majanohamensis TaxID=467976 RepID=A0AAE9Y9H8_9ACTN|nr:acyl-CoA dehydrogenase family protein [Iamia majanohamensis]WCO68266.1 acyl-CoA dehydrogenase family protein [Iamia majanohamensis]
MTDALLDAARDLFPALDEIGAAVPPGEALPRKAMDLLADAGLVGPMVPEEVGGLGLDVLATLDLYEEVARADGSVGWCYFASDLTAAYFGAYLPDSGAERVFAEGVPTMAGQFAPNGTARAEGDELVLDGDYRFGSGLAHATWAGAGVMATPEDGGDPDYLFACFPADEVDVQGGWDVMGLQATASYDYAVRDVRVPTDQSFDFFVPTVHRGRDLHRLGVIPLTAAGHAGWALGVTRRVLDELEGLAASTTRMGAPSSLAESDRALVEIGELEGRWHAGRAFVREAAAAAEAEARDHGAAGVRAQTLLREAARHVNQGGADIARQAYLLAGTTALRDGPIQRGFRDLHAGAQHFFASPSVAADLARVVLAEA